MNLLDERQDRIICDDGAMGMLLFDPGVAVDQSVEELGLTRIPVPFLSETGRLDAMLAKSFGV